jgi:hypothetical protein
MTALHDGAYPFRSANGYGLFRVMTRQRYEIVIEGSDDGATWKTYEFRYKPGEVNHRPAFCEPHMPRLDWQMWFEALRPGQETGFSPWFVQFMHRLLENSPPVVALLRTNPFPDRPPRYVRARLYDYHFTTRAERAASGAWWRREPIGEYLPPVTLKNFASDAGQSP